MARIQKGETITHQFLNGHEEAAEWYRRFKARGEGGSLKATPVNFSKVSAANYTGAQIYIGDVCEFDGNPFADIYPAEKYPDPRSDRWVKAVTPNATRLGWGIALDPIVSAGGADREGGEFLVLGVCHARVVIENEDHKYAERRDTFRTLFSAATGPAKILHKPAAVGALPEERLCLIQIMDEPGGETSEMVYVNHDATTSGNTVEANAAGFHPGNILSYVDFDSYSGGTDIWIRFAEAFAGGLLAVQGEYYGPAKPTGETYDLVENEGEEDETHDERPVYILESNEQQFLCKADSAISKGGSGTVSIYHSTDLTDTGINRTAVAIGADITGGKWSVYFRLAGVWCVSPWECGGE